LITPNGYPVKQGGANQRHKVVLGILPINTRPRINKPAVNTTSPRTVKIAAGEGDWRPSQVNNNKKDIDIFQYIPSTR
jgi:hypothetical protein